LIAGVVTGMTMTARTPSRWARQRHALGMIARRGADDAPCQCFAGQFDDLVVSAAQLEGEYRLQILAFESSTRLWRRLERRGKPSSGLSMATS
jgi:hypothetical protein